MSQYSSQEIKAKKPRIRENTWNALTILALLATMAVVIVLLVIFNDPAAGINPYPPPVKAGLVEPSPTVTSLPPTWTPTLEPTLAAATDLPATAEESAAKPTTAVIVLVGTPAEAENPQLTPEAAKPSRFAFGLQAQPQGIAASLYEPTRACAWMGVAGRVFDIQNRPVKGVRVAITGWFGGHTLNLLSLTGTALQYGPSGYEFTLADAPQATIGLVKIQLLDQADLPLSDVVVLDTYVECEKNLILVDFKQINE